MVNKPTRVQSSRQMLFPGSIGTERHKHGGRIYWEDRLQAALAYHTGSMPTVNLANLIDMVAVVQPCICSDCVMNETNEDLFTRV